MLYSFEKREYSGYHTYVFMTLKVGKWEQDAQFYVDVGGQKKHIRASTMLGA
jgi:hypothetical protein